MAAIDSTRHHASLRADRRTRARAALEELAARESQGTSLLEIFDATVRAHPSAIALDADDGALTYAALAKAAERLARRLRKQGVGPGERVGHPPRKRLLAVSTSESSASCARAPRTCPIDADDPPTRAAAIWSEADVCGVLEEDLSLRELRRPRAPKRPPCADDDAWIIFTSGSTGRPKGVAVSHRSAAAFVEAERRLWTVHAYDRVLAGLSVSFDASCEEMWMAWSNGAALVPAPRAIVRSGADLGPWLVRRGITVVSTVPTLAAMWDEQTLANVRLLVLGGEACQPELGWRLAEGREVWNTYGPTEATVVTTATRIRPAEPVMIGWPLAGWEVAVLDDCGCPVPLGEPGELVIAGVGLGRYLDSSSTPSVTRGLPALGWERAYRSGDIVRETIDGFEFLGRRDGQVKIAGRRLELGEVESKLSAVAGVRSAAAVVQSTAAGQQGARRLRDRRGLLRGRARRRRRAAARRACAGGRRARGDAARALREGRSQGAAVAAAGGRGPADETLTGTAAWLAERFADQLGPVAISADTDFFASGGNSLAPRSSSRALRERYPSVAVADVYEHRRLGDLVQRVEELARPGEEAPEAESSAPWRWGAAQFVGMLVLLVVQASSGLSPHSPTATSSAPGFRTSHGGG